MSLSGLCKDGYCTATHEGNREDVPRRNIYSDAHWDEKERCIWIHSRERSHHRATSNKDTRGDDSIAHYATPQEGEMPCRSESDIGNLEVSVLSIALHESLERRYLRERGCAVSVHLDFARDYREDCDLQCTAHGIPINEREKN